MNQHSLPLECLIDEAYQQLERLGYRPETLRGHWRIWRVLLRWSRKQGVQTFTEDLATKFLEKYSIPLGESAKPLSSYHRHIRASIRILKEFAFYGSWQRRRPTKDKLLFPPTFEVAVRDFLKFREIQHGVGPLTLYVGKLHLFLFTSFLESRNVRSWADLCPGTFPVFFAFQKHLEPATLSNYASTLRTFLKYLWHQGLHSEDLSSHIPQFQVQRKKRIPSVWKQEDVEALLAAVDRGSPLGKRDYAILVLVTHLGLRAGEIRTLKLDHFCWEKAQLDLFQPKTWNTVVLPLSEEVGQAVIEYLRHGRPHVPCREVFIRHNAPFEPFADNCEFHYIITNYRQKAKIKLNYPSRHGLHSLRHTLASRLLEQGTSLETIAAILGHASVETTRMYTSIDLEALRDVALDPEEVFHE